MAQDPLSAILSLVEAQATFAGGFAAGGSWAVRFPPPAMVKFFAIGQGQCQIRVEGIEHLFTLEVGDVFLLSANRSFTIASDASLDPQDAQDVFGNRKSSIINVGRGSDFLFLGSHLDIKSYSGRRLIESLPATIHLRASENGAGQLQWLIREMAYEARASYPGVDVARSGLAQLMFLHILRAYLAGKRHLEVGLLRAACDPRLAPALTQMHGDPARNWTLLELAAISAMSRTAFAAHFKSVSGLAPLTYLTHWRMRVAERSLLAGTMSLADVAQAVGYGSEAAFSTAFKRVIGQSPRQSRQAAKLGQGLPIGR
jgi:AraC-like DNA-binding protein